MTTTNSTTTTDWTSWLGSGDNETTTDETTTNFSSWSPLNTTLTAVTSTVTTLIDTVTALNSTATTLNTTTVTALNTTVTVLNTTVTALNTTVTALNTTVTALNATGFPLNTTLTHAINATTLSTHVGSVTTTLSQAALTSGLVTTIQTSTTAVTASATSPGSTPPQNSAITDSVRVFAGSFMIIIALLALIGNIGVIIALRHRCFKDRAMYTFLNNLAITMVVDCLFNAPFICGALFTDEAIWLYGSFLCSATAFVFNFVHTQVILSLLLLVLDRLFSLRYSEAYIRKFEGVKANLVAGYTWVHSIAFTVAIVVTSVSSEYFEFRFICSVSYEGNLVYNIVFTLLCNIAPWVTVMCCYVYIVIQNGKTNRRNKSLAQAGYDELASIKDTENELNHAKPVGILVLLWCALIGPYQIINMIYVYSGNGSIPTILWTIFTCLKFTFDLLVAVVILVAWPEAWKECKHAITCHRDNAIQTGTREDLETPCVRRSWADGSDCSTTERSTLDRSTISRSYPIPVLFATSNGLQLQVSSRNNKDGGSIEVANLASENPSDKYRKGSRPGYLPPLFTPGYSSEEDSFNTNSSVPLNEGEESFDLNESADSKTAVSQFNLSLGRSSDFQTMKSAMSSPSPRGHVQDFNKTYTHHPTGSNPTKNSNHEPKKRKDFHFTTNEGIKQKTTTDISESKKEEKGTRDQALSEKFTEHEYAKRIRKASKENSQRNPETKEQNQSKHGIQGYRHDGRSPKTQTEPKQSSKDVQERRTPDVSNEEVNRERSSAKSDANRKDRQPKSASHGNANRKGSGNSNVREVTSKASGRANAGLAGGGSNGGVPSGQGAADIKAAKPKDGSADKRRRHSSGKSVGSNKSSPRGATVGVANQAFDSKP